MNTRRKKNGFLLPLIAILLSYCCLSPVLGYDDITSQAQRILTEKGYTVGPIDGIFGGKTESAIKAFQNDASLPTTGKLDDSTKEALGIKRGKEDSLDSVAPSDGAGIQRAEQTNATGASNTTSVASPDGYESPGSPSHIIGYWDSNYAALSFSRDRIEATQKLEKLRVVVRFENIESCTLRNVSIKPYYQLLYNTENVNS